MYQKRLAAAALCLLLSCDYLFAQSGSDPHSGAAIDTNRVRPPVFPPPEEAAKITTKRVIRKFPEIGFQFSGSFGWLKIGQTERIHIFAPNNSTPSGSQAILAASSSARNWVCGFLSAGESLHFSSGSMAGSRATEVSVILSLVQAFYTRRFAPMSCSPLSALASVVTSCVQTASTIKT